MEKVLVEFIDTLDRSFKKLLTEAGSISKVSQLTISQFQYISAIQELNEPTITKISLHLSIAKASVSTGVSKLIDKGFVTKTQSDKDKRVFYLRLTEVGQKLMAARQKAFQEYIAFINTSLTPEEAQQLETILAKLVTLFSQQ